ncbi:MAG: ABC transporter ATP-binding protein [Thermoguttaceae bacterium]
MIEFENVARNYGSKPAVAGLSMTIASGELFAFLGPNGAGKTTTIKMLTGLLRPSAGKITVCGHDTVAASREVARNVGYVPDEPYLYDKLSGREFLEFVGRMHGLGNGQVDDRIEREADRFQLGGFLADLAESYSHGMKQRVVFAAALMHDPPVLVVDEPMVGLDPRSARLVKDLFREATAAGTTVFMSTHGLSLAEELADRIGIIDEGRLQFLGVLPEVSDAHGGTRTSLEGLFLELTGGNGCRAGAEKESEEPCRRS